MASSPGEYDLEPPEPLPRSVVTLLQLCGRLGPNSLVVKMSLNFELWKGAVQGYKDISAGRVYPLADVMERLGG